MATSTTELDSIDVRDIPTINIISSHKISAKVTRCLHALYPSSASVSVIALRCQSAVASKAITIAEIVKRRMVEHGDCWFQYTKLHSEVTEVKVATTTSTTSTATAVEPADEDEDEDDPYIVRPDKVESKKRTIPIITIYISRVRIRSLASQYGLVLLLFKSA
ncbi:hypothetical protein EDC01DRAFT_622948 [Geopyxis carbonaria]|nr:hypothetical protein EDC01DRAFT_622948 [Geopyxis carbonaria]